MEEINDYVRDKKKKSAVSLWRISDQLQQPPLPPPLLRPSFITILPSLLHFSPSTYTDTTSTSSHIYIANLPVTILRDSITLYNYLLHPLHLQPLYTVINCQGITITLDSHLHPASSFFSPSTQRASLPFISTPDRSRK